MKYFITILLLVVSLGFLNAQIAFYTPVTNVVRMNADQTINSTTRTDLNGLSFSVEAGSTYTFKVYLFMETQNAAADFKAGWTSPTGIGRLGAMNVENAVSNQADVNGVTNNIPVATSTLTNGDVIILVGILTPDANGVIQIDARNNAGTNAQTILSHSHLKWEKI